MQLGINMYNLVQINWSNIVNVKESKLDYEGVLLLS